jgi:hypothetical protein
MLGISSLDEYVHLDSNSATFLVASPKLPGTAVEIFFQVYCAEASGGDQAEEVHQSGFHPLKMGFL